MGRFQPIGSKEIGFLVIVYGPHLPQEKTCFLNNLLLLQKLHQDGNFIIHDEFNIITSLKEKNGGIKILDVETQAFKVAIYPTGRSGHYQ